MASLIVLFILVALVPSHPGLAQEKISYSVPPDQWEEKYGNHRAVIEVEKPSDAVGSDFLWRRHDALPKKRQMLIIDAKTGIQVKNILRVKIDNERCTLVFGPVPATGSYYFYYLPYSPVTDQYYSGEYLPVEDAPDSLWVLGHQLSRGFPEYRNVSKAIITGIQARTEFHSFYPMGMGRMGGFTPANHISRWLKTEDSFWIGETTGGIQCELRGGSYHGPLRNLYQPNPSPSWFNGMNGGFRIDSDENTVTASAYSGARKMTKGQSVTYEFALLITPVRKLDLKSQFTNRYFHSVEPTPEVIANGGNVMNVHHANKYNPYLNYPFIAQKELRGLVDQWHEKGWKIKLYYTVRELSNHLTEIWALRSLGFEVLADGNGGGYQWLREHLVSNYSPQWYTHLGNGEVDAAILNSGESRWYNYYIEGLAWLNEPVNVKLNIDWKHMGLKPGEVTIIAPEIKDYQKGRSFKVDEPIPVDAKGDCLLILSRKFPLR